MAKTEKGIYKDGDEWRVSFDKTINGTLHRVHKRGYKSAGEATIAKNQILKELYEIEEIKVNGNFGTLMDDFFKHREPTLKNSTLHRLKQITNKHFKDFYPHSLSVVSSYDNLIDLHKYFLSLKVTKNYANKIIRLFRDVMDYGYKRGLITNEAFNNVNLVMTYLKENDRNYIDGREVWTKDDYLIFLEVIPTESRDYVLFSLWGQIGTRIGEIRALQVKHIDFKKNTVRIEQQANSKLGKGMPVITSPKTRASYRTISITPTLTKLLKEYIKSLELSHNDFVFYGATKNMPIGETTIRFALKKYCKNADVPYMNPHGIRHSNTTWLLMGEHSLEEIGIISERLGHTNKTTTLNIYFHINKKDSKNILETLSFLD